MISTDLSEALLDGFKKRFGAIWEEELEDAIRLLLQAEDAYWRLRDAVDTVMLLRADANA